MTTRKEAIKLAEAARIPMHGDFAWDAVHADHLIPIIDAVKAQTRERCARVCDDQATFVWTKQNYAQHCAAAIRAMED